MKVVLKDTDDIVLVSVAIDALIDSMIVSKVSLEHLVENNGKDKNPTYQEFTIDLLKDEIKEIDIAMSRASTLKERLDKAVELINPEIESPNWNG